MKKLQLILLCLPMIGFGQSTLILDANFEQALINLGYDTGTPNGSVPTSNINTVDELFISNQNISDLTGIEYFTALEHLYCDNNNLTFLDLSSNLLLEEVDCSNNNLTSLVFGYNLSLDEVICSNNQISSLDFSNYPDFSWLECENNVLVALNLRNSNNNSFHSIKIANNPLLTCIEVDDASDSYSDWNGVHYSFDTQHYFHGIINYSWVDAGLFSPPNSMDASRDLVIDNNNIMYQIEGIDKSVYKYDPSSSNIWIDIGDNADALALDQNNNLYKVSLEKYYTNNPNPSVYIINKVALKIMNYNGSSWILNSVDTIYSNTAPSNTSNTNLYGVFKIEDFLIDYNNDAYISLMKNEYALDLMYDYSNIIIKKYNINTNSWNSLPDPEIIKEHFQYFSVGGSISGAYSWFSTKDLNTGLDINPSNGNIIVAGQQANLTMTQSGWYDPIVLTNHVVKEFNGSTWSLLGNPLVFSNFAPKAGGAFLAANNAGDLICAFTNDKGGFGQPYEDDTLMIYKYNFTTSNWDSLPGGNPHIEMYYVNSMSIDINEDGEPAIAFEGAAWSPYLTMMTGMQVVLKYDNNSHTWDTIASPVDGPSVLQEEWYQPIIRFNSNDQPFINYYQDLSGGNTVTLQEEDSSLCGSTVSVPEMNTTVTINKNKSLIKIIDILGRETKQTNQPLFYIYDDGTVEKRIIID